MKVDINNKLNVNNQNKKQIPFKGPLDGALTQSLALLDTNPMANAAIIDLLVDDSPRIYLDAKKRNKFAAAETAFREITGTFIVCISSGLFARYLSGIGNKVISPPVKLENFWATDKVLDLFSSAWNNGNKKTEEFVKNVISNISGTDKTKTNKWSEIKWDKVEWYDKNAWKRIKWKDSKYAGIINNLKDEKSILKTLTEIINDKNIDKSDTKNILKILESRIGNALKASENVDINFKGKAVSSSISNILRDIYDTGKNLFNNKNLNVDDALKKLSKINKLKTFGGIGLAIALAIINQTINRKITKKRTGTDDFVGNVDYIDNLKNKKLSKKTDKKLILEKTAISAIFATMVAKVLNVKNLKDLAKKLEITGPSTGGAAIKLVFATLVLGRFFASKDKNELRESATRDILCFLNWLVLGGFVSKGVGNLLDKSKKNLFNISSEGKGLKHWLRDVSLKSHAEIVAQGGKDMQKNLRKLNIAHLSGILYSALALGFGVTNLNIWLTKKLHKPNPQSRPHISAQSNTKPQLPSVFRAIESNQA